MDLADALTNLTSTDPQTVAVAVSALLPHVRCVANRYRAHVEVDDGTQIAILRLIDTAKVYDPTRSPYAWISTIVHRAVMSEAKRLRNTYHRPIGKQVVSIDEERTDAGQNLTAVLVDHHAADPVNVAIEHEATDLAAEVVELLRDELTPLERSAWQAIVLDGRTYEDIAAEHHVDRKKIDNARQRAVQKLAALCSNAPDLIALKDRLEKRAAKAAAIRSGALPPSHGGRLPASGVPGVIKGPHGTWIARHRRKHLGRFATIEAAAEAIEKYRAGVPVTKEKNPHGRTKGEAPTTRSNMAQKNENSSEQISALKIALYETIEAQAVLNHQHQQLETRKGELSKELSEARQEFHAEQQPAETPKKKSMLEV